MANNYFSEERYINIAEEAEKNKIVTNEKMGGEC